MGTQTELDKMNREEDGIMISENDKNRLMLF